MSVVNRFLEGKTVIVTGGKRGLGKAIALAMAGAGADVVVCGRKIDDGELEGMAEEVRRLGSRSLAIRADISQKADVDNLVQAVVGEFGAIDILVNNAAMNIMAPLMELREEGWDKVMDNNLKGHYLCCQAVGQQMMARKQGNIINIASTAALKADKVMGAYCIAKAGVVMLTRVLALELAEYNIRVNAIAPYVVETKFSQPIWNTPEGRRETEAKIPLGRLAQTADITGTVLFLASDAASYITGHTIVIDGGYMA